jgi:hypothetical protein
MPAAHGAIAPTAALRPRLSYYIPRSLRGTRRNGDVVAQLGSRCTVAGEKAGRHTATYSAPVGSGVL